MEILKRKIKSEREENQNSFSGSIINNVRLSLRWADKDNLEKDLVINFTMKETNLIRQILKGGQND